MTSQSRSAFKSVLKTTLTSLSAVGLSLSASSALSQEAKPADKAAEASAGQASAQPAQASPSPTATPASSASVDPAEARAVCMETLTSVVRAKERDRLKIFCEAPQHLPVCNSTEGRKIQHADWMSTDARGKKILVLGLIHGDEPLAGEMALDWAQRLSKLDSFRNSWRVVPMLNPDGLRLKTRMNARGVDLNRNFPTRDWENEAIAYWKKAGKSDPRRYPGEGPASEAETKCIIAQIKDFKPDFIVSVHTPYKVLDFDGPKMSFPPYRDLPWRALGNFPGSLGRYMWKDLQVPVLTVELGSAMVDSGKLQDIVGTFAIEAARRSGQKTVLSFEHL